MDAFVNTNLLGQMISELDGCKLKLEYCITTIKAEYKIADAILSGEQFEKLKDKATAACENINNTIDGLFRLKAFISELEPHIFDYDETRYG